MLVPGERNTFACHREVVSIKAVSILPLIFNLRVEKGLPERVLSHR